MYQRALGVYCLMLTLFGILVMRLAYLAMDPQGLAQVATQQSSYTLEVASSRGMIYDCRMTPLVNRQAGWVAAIAPTAENAGPVLQAVETAQRAAVLALMEEGTPFLYPVTQPDLYLNGVVVAPLLARTSSGYQPARHLIGELDAATGQGASGIEYAFDDLLTRYGGSLQVRYQLDAARRLLPGAPVQVEDTGYNQPGGVVLTIDSQIQQIADQAAQSIAQGAVVVMDPATGDVKALVSRPSYAPDQMQQAVESEDSPLINRAFYAYSVGSTFKLLLAATALDAGFSPGWQYDCQGAIEIGDQVYHCHNLAGHGLIDMPQAIEHSCNPYFVALGQRLGGELLAFNATQVGFGRATRLTDSYHTQSGVLPDAGQLQSAGALANFSFGQGNFTATPLQVAALVSCIANGGLSVEPRLVLGETADGLTVTDPQPTYANNRVFSQQAAGQVAQMMVQVVAEGSGTKAAPLVGGAGGKTASAQTGSYDEDGQEVVHAWFSGFYPAEDPQYVIVVLVEGGDSGSDTAAPVFRQIANRLASLVEWPADDPGQGP